MSDNPQTKGGSPTNIKEVGAGKPTLNADPFDIAKTVRGVLLLIVVCVILYGVTKYGLPAGDWISHQIQLLCGLEPKIPAEVVIAEAKVDSPNPEKSEESKTIDPPKVAGTQVSKTPIQLPTPPVPVATPPLAIPPKPEAKPSKNPLIIAAREQIVEALGGPEKAEVRHIAISKDETALLASVKLIKPEGDEKIEIAFEQDSFNTYLSKPDAPIAEVIRIFPPNE